MKMIFYILHGVDSNQVRVVFIDAVGLDISQEMSEETVCPLIAIVLGVIDTMRMRGLFDFRSGALRVRLHLLMMVKIVTQGEIFQKRIHFRARHVVQSSGLVHLSMLGGVIRNDSWEVLQVVWVTVEWKTSRCSLLRMLRCRLNEPSGCDEGGDRWKIFNFMFLNLAGTGFEWGRKKGCCDSTGSQKGWRNQRCNPHLQQIDGYGKMKKLGKEL
jgi:hypothetical protein